MLNYGGGMHSPCALVSLNSFILTKHSVIQSRGLMFYNCNEIINMKKYKKEALFWHTLWHDCGCPRSGTVANIHRTTRAKYSYAVKYVHENKANIIAYFTINQKIFGVMLRESEVKRVLSLVLLMGSKVIEM